MITQTTHSAPLCDAWALETVPVARKGYGSGAHEPKPNGSDRKGKKYLFEHSCRSHCRGLNGSDFWSNLEQSLNCNSQFPPFLPHRSWNCFISFWYFFCSCEFSVAGTEINASFLPCLYHLDLFPIFLCSRRFFLPPLFGPCNDLSPSLCLVATVTQLNNSVAGENQAKCML